MSNVRANLMVCGGTGCISGGGLKFKDALEKELASHGMQAEFNVVMSGCNGLCAEGPIMTVLPEGILYEKLKPEHAATIVDEHLVKGRIVEKLLYKMPGKPTKVPYMKDIPFYNLQVLRALRNKGLIDPEKIEDYIARDGYMGAAKVLSEMSPVDVIKTMKESGLRGRGGAGFLSGLKWEVARNAADPVRYMICNGDEGDPGAFMDRSLMEADPHAVIEGMIIGAYAIGAHEGYIFVRAEYPLAISRLEVAIRQAREAGLLGPDILGKGFDFDIEIFQSPGAFVCGESTALMRSIEGKRGMPRPSPPNSVVSGLWDKPTVLNNVETLACIPQIMLNGAAWFRSVGTEKSTGTKVICLGGSVNNVGLIEVPMGTPLKQVVYDIGGGLPKGRKFKSVQIGGPSGGFIPEHLMDTPLTFEDIAATGATLGSGIMGVMDDLSCIVTSAKFFIDFSAEESCGKCPPCRVGNTVMQELLVNLTEGRGKEGDVDLILDLSHDIMATSLCGLGKAAPYPIVNAIQHYRSEFEEHINGYCRAGVCRDLVTFHIDEEACKACGACKRGCPVNAIAGEKKVPHVINQEACIKCRSCLEVCKFGAVLTGPASLREEILKNQAVKA